MIEKIERGIWRFFSLTLCIRFILRFINYRCMHIDRQYAHTHTYNTMYTYGKTGRNNLDSFYFFFCSDCCGQNFQNYVE